MACLPAREAGKCSRYSETICTLLEVGFYCYRRREEWVLRTTHCLCSVGETFFFILKAVGTLGRNFFH